MAERILVVEDNPVGLATVSLFLREQGYFVVQAIDGNRALKVLQDGFKFDLVLSDISLPGIDGYGLLKYVRCRFPSTPVILMSGNFTLGCPAVLNGGADEYLLKPLDLEQLLDKINAALHHAQVAVELIPSGDGGITFPAVAPLVKTPKRFM